MSAIPQWLTDALADYTPPPAPRPGPAHRNDFAIVRGSVGESTVQRVVLITEEHERHFTVLLCHPYKEMATDYDVIALRDNTYDLVIGTDLYGVVLKHQVVGIVGSVSDELRDAARHSLHTDGESVEGIGPRAMPLGGVDDPRRRFKEEELEDLMILRNDAHRLLLGDDW